MQAIKGLYKIGYGPSSSHTIAPYRIANYYKEQFKDCDRYEIVLGGSLALTAMGHGTLDIIKTALGTDEISFIYDRTTKENIMNITGYKNETAYKTWQDRKSVV